MSGAAPTGARRRPAALLAAATTGARRRSAAVLAAGAAALVAAALALALAGGESRAGGAAPMVVTVLVERPSGVPERATGFVAAPGRVVTVAHVLDGGGAVAVQAPGGARRKAAVVRVDRAADLALLAAATTGGDRVRAGGATTRGTAARVITAGGPRAVTVRRQIRARVRDSAGPRVYTRAALELAADVSAGDSGAPVLHDGRLAGVVFARSRRHDGTAYAVGAAAVDRLLKP